ncbi:hypothetical protein [Catenulispora rubra]|uniref:hypothetical protein n=1 Tax=Catenulispora rubra TaxID=280293 RepID=UPI0018925634|nr:hypothetical protein [Catenulispora rubra]
MADQVWVDTDRMSVVSPQVEELARKTQGARSGLVEAVSRLADAAGNDAAGQAFKASHDPVRDQVVGAMHDFVQITNGMLTGIGTMVRGYVQTEENNTVPKTFDAPAPETSSHPKPPSRP